MISMVPPLQLTVLCPLLVLEEVGDAVEEREDQGPDAEPGDPAGVDRVTVRVVDQRVASGEVQGIADRQKSGEESHKWRYWSRMKSLTALIYQ